MSGNAWLLYGAYGYTGRLIINEARARGHSPVLAGRSAERLIPLAQRLGLDHLILDLRDPTKLTKKVAEFDLVFNAAGPFIHTSDPLIHACLEGHTHYVDITGELPVFENTLSHHRKASNEAIALISGIGFAVIPTDCMAKHVSDKVPDATRLQLAFGGIGGLSPGTVKTILEHAPSGVLVRRDGQLVHQPPVKGARRFRFFARKYTAFPITWGDLATAYRTTGIPNITTYTAFPPSMARPIRSVGPIAQHLLSIGVVRHTMLAWATKHIRGPDEQTRKTARSFVWARAANDRGDEAEAWLETWAAYQFTALAGVRCVERVIESRPRGALTPTQAFGTDYILEIPGTKRYDQLNDTY